MIYINFGFPGLSLALYYLGITLYHIRVFDHLDFLILAK